MTALTAREVVDKLHQYDDLPLFLKVNIHFLAAAPGNDCRSTYLNAKPKGDTNGRAYRSLQATQRS
jgi:protease I